MVSFGALIAFTAVNFSVFMKFFVQDKQRQGLKNVFLNLVLPLLSVGVMLGLWINLEMSALICGCIWLAVGVLLYMYKHLRKQNIVISSAY